MANFEMHDTWELEVYRAILPQFQEITNTVNAFIDEEAPVDTGTLRDATHADLDADTCEIYVSVSPQFVNPKTGQSPTDYAKYVIEGTSRHPEPNDYPGRAVAAALQIFNGSHHA